MKSKRRLLSLILVFSMIAGLYPNSYVYAYSDTESLEVSSEETADEATAAYPAFHPEPVTMDGVEIKVSADEGVFPESAVFSVNKPKASEEKKIENIIEEERSGTEHVAASYTYDIKVLDADGNELQPEDGQKVEVSFSMAEVSNTNLDTNVYHISEDASGQLSADVLQISENDDTVTAETDGFSYYTVEFTYDEKQYVMQGDSTVALTDILSFVGVTKVDGSVAEDSDITAVSVSDESLFSASNESGEWMVTAHQAFHTDEWMKVTVDVVEYEIVVTDATDVTVSSPGYKTLVFNRGTEYTFTFANGLKLTKNVSDGVNKQLSDGGGGTGYKGTISLEGTLTIMDSSGTQQGQYSINDYNAWKIDYISGNPSFCYFYRTNISIDPTYTTPTLASDFTYNGSAQQLISSAGSTSGNNMQYGISTSSDTQPSNWYSSISDSNMKRTDVGTYYVWYKCDAVSNYNAVAATCVGSVSIAKASNPITYGSQSWSYIYATTAQTNTLNDATSAQGTVTYSLQSQKRGNNTVNYFTFNTSTRVLTAAANTPTGTYTVVVRASAAGGSNYNSGTADSTITVTVNKAAGSISYGTTAVTKTYGDAAFANTLTKAGDGTVSYSSSNTSVASINSNGQVTIVGAGTATITATVADGTNYSYASKTATYSLTVNRKAITIKANDQTITYGGTITTGTGKVTVNTLVSGDTLTNITLTPSTGNATTNGIITPSDATIKKNNTDVANNYNISYQTGKLVINKADISPAVSITGWTYGEYSSEINSPNVTGNMGNGAVTYEYKVKDAADNTYTASVPTDAGNYTVRATIAETSNYNGRTATKDFTISTAAMSVTAIGYNDTYDGQAHGITVIAPEGATVKYRTTNSGDYALTANPTFTDAGTYTVYYQVTKPNYTTVTGSETVVINKKLVELSWDDSTRSFTYDGVSHKPSADIYGVLEDDECNVSISGEQINYSESPYTATASLTGAKKNNYQLPNETTTTFTIAKKEIVVKWHIGDVVYDGVERIPSFIFNGKNQKPSATAIGLVEGDTCEVTVTGEKKDVGQYTATASSLSNNNYKLPDEPVTITFTITPRTITTDDISFGHSGELEPGHYEYTGDVIIPEITISTVLAGDTVATGLILNTDYSMSLDTSAVSTGTHYIKFEGKGNYDGIVYKAWNIDPTIITVTADNKNKTYGYDDPELTVTVTGPSDAVDEIAYTVSREHVGEDEGENVGTHVIKVEGDDKQGNYTVNFVNGTLTINQAPVTVTVGNKSKNYGDDDPTFTSTVTGLKRNDTEEVITRTISRAAGEDAGSYTITPTGEESQGNYSVIYNTGTLTIKKRKLTADFVRLNPVSFQYDGTNKSPNVEFDKYNPALTADYTISGETTANDKGRHSITVNGVGTNFTGTVTLYWYITGVGDNEVTYDGLPHTINADEDTTGITTYKEADGTTYSESAPVYTEAGSYTIYYKTTVDNPMHNYIPDEPETLDIEGSAVLTIKKAPLTVNAEDKTKLYGEDDPVFTYTVTGLQNDEQAADVFTGDLAREEGENVGKYPITQGTLAPDNNYYIETFNNGTLSVTKIPLTVECFDVNLTSGDYNEKLNKNEVEYTGSEWKANVAADAGITGIGTVTPKYFKVDGKSETPIEAAPVYAGKYRVKLQVAEGDNYQATAEGQYITSDDWWFEIVKAPFPDDTVDANWPTANTGLVYSGSAQALLTAPTTTLSGYTMNYRIDDGVWGTAIPTGKDAVGYTVYAKYVSTDPANRLDSEERSYTVSIAPRPITVTADNKSKTYGTDDPELTYTVTTGSLVDEDTLSGELSRKEGEDVREGGYAINAGTLTNDNNPNYDITFVPGTFTITRAALTPSVSIEDWIYGDTASVPVVNGNTGNGEVTYTYAVRNSAEYTEAVPTDAGEYTIKASIAANGNCEAGEATADFVITKKQVEVAAENKEKEYGSEDPALTYTVTSKNGSDASEVLSNPVLSDISIARTAGENVNESGYAITVSQSDGANPNYDISFVPGTFSITRKSVTVTADNASKVYGAEEPASFTATVEGLVGNDSIDYSVTRAIGEDVGEYAITPAGDVTQGNYTVSYAAGTFTITKATLAVTAEAKSKTYGETDPDLTYAVDGFVNGDTAETVMSGGLSRASGENAGTYAIEQNTLSAGDNYTISYTGADFTIGKKTLTVTAAVKSKTYGNADPSLTYNADGFENDDTAETVMTGALTRVAGEDVRDGGYAILQGTLTAGNNYNISYTGADLTITKRNVTLTSASDTKAYNGTALTNDDITVGGDGFADNEGAEYDVTGSQILPGESDNTFTYELTGAKPDNYNITTAYGKLTVNERNGEGDDGKYKITVKANSGTFIYDGKAHTVTGFETLEYTINDVTYTVSGISASGSLTDAGETTVEITGTPKVADAEGNDLTGSFDVICEDGKLTVKKCSQEKPDGLSSRKTSSNTAKDGVITGLDENKLYEYSEDDGINWSKVDEGSAEVTGIGAGDVLVRFQEDGNRLPGEVADVIVGIKENQAAPLREDFVITNASEENASDGKISGVDDTMEYSLDDGKNWTPVEENQTVIDNLPVGDTELRYKGDEDKNPGEALKIPIGVTSRTQGVVNFNHNNTSETEISVTTVVEAAASSNIEDFAATQMEKGKDVKVELEIIPQKEEEVSEESVAKIGDTVKKVFAGIETESIVTEYLQIDLAKYVDNAKEGNISDTKTPLEIELTYDKSKTGNPVIIRTHNGAVKAFEKLMTRPAGGFRDGTYHVADGKIYLYSQYFSDFAIVYATEKTYYVNIDIGNGESIQKIVGENDGIELPANLTREGYSFGGLYKDASYKDAWNYDTDKVNEDITLYGKWNKSVSGVSVTPDNVKFTKAGETSQINVTITPEDAANTKVTYKSSDTKVATVDANGKITAVANGTATITVTTEDGAKTATVKVIVEIPDVPKQGTSEQTTTEQPKTTEQPLQEPTKEEKAEISMNAGLKISQTGSKINIKWGKVKEADGYDVYVTYCGMDFNKKKPNKTLKKNSLVSTTITKINGKKINLKKNYKIYVVAYRMVEGKKVKLARTITGHIVGRLNTKYSNVRKITLFKSKYSVKVGKTVKVKAKTVLVDQSKKQLSNAHAAEFRYASSNKNIATVDKNGKIKGVAKGTCTIYVYARNGYAKTVSVTVK